MFHVSIRHILVVLSISPHIIYLSNVSRGNVLSNSMWFKLHTWLDPSGAARTKQGIVLHARLQGLPIFKPQGDDVMLTELETVTGIV